MTDIEKAKHLAVRQKRAEAILYELERFKVCDQCRSISYRRASTCPVCGAYRFSEDRDFVQETAAEMGRNPFPVTSGTVPRIKGER